MGSIEWLAETLSTSIKSIVNPLIIKPINYFRNLNLNFSRASEPDDIVLTKKSAADGDSSTMKKRTSCKNQRNYAYNDNTACKKKFAQRVYTDVSDESSDFSPHASDDEQLQELLLRTGRRRVEKKDKKEIIKVLKYERKQKKLVVLTDMQHYFSMACLVVFYLGVAYFSRFYLRPWIHGDVKTNKNDKTDE